MRHNLCTVILVCGGVTLAAGQEVSKESAPVAKPAATAHVQQILKDRFREYTEALTSPDLAALDKIWAEGYTFTNGRGEFLTKKYRMENIKSGATQLTPSSARTKRSASSETHTRTSVIYSKMCG